MSFCDKDVWKLHRKMERNKERSNKLSKINVLHRPSLRGLKKCQSCGTISGQRALICRNVNCDLRKRLLTGIKPFDPIQLITRNDLRVFSLKTRDKFTNVRNFVRMTMESSNASTPTHGGAATARNAVCYVDSCKYDPSSMAATGCRHVKACTAANDIPQAVVFPLDMNVLWNLNITDKQKQHLRELYEHDRENVQPIQKLDASTFVVACDTTNNFNAGRLHVTVVANTVAKRKGFYSCACRKLKITVDADNSVIMKKEICDHILLVLAAILNKPDGKTMYADFLESLKYLWIPNSLNLPLESVTDAMETDVPFIKFEELSSAADVTVSRTPDDIFNFSEEILTEDSIHQLYRSDFSDIIPNVQTANVPPTNFMLECQEDKTAPIAHTKDEKLNSCHNVINADDFGLFFSHVDAPETNPSPSVQTPICLLEQFQLGEDINVSNDNKALAEDIEFLNELESDVSQFSPILQAASSFSQNQLPPKPQQKPKEILNKNTTVNTNSFGSVINKPTCKNVFLNKPVVVKQNPVKIIKIATPGDIQKLKKVDKKFVQISKVDSSKLVVINHNNSKRRPISIQPINSFSVTSTVPSPPVPEEYQLATSVPSVSYESWLDHIIEILNDSIILQDSNNIKHTFHVQDKMFSHFSKTFGFNNSYRQPNSTTRIKNGKHKGLLQYTWYFNQAAAVTRIFSTKNSKLELQRSSEPLKNSNFVPFLIKLSNEITVTQLTPIQTKLPESRVFLKFSNAPETAMDKPEWDKTGLKLDWLPSAFPKSHFGLMAIEFCVYTYTSK